MFQIQERRVDHNGAAMSSLVSYCAFFFLISHCGKFIDLIHFQVDSKFVAYDSLAGDIVHNGEFMSGSFLLPPSSTD